MASTGAQDNAQAATGPPRRGGRGRGRARGGHDGSPGRGRGRGRGSRGGGGGGASAQDKGKAPAVEPAAPAQPRGEEADVDGDSDGDGDVCFICASPVQHTAIAPCNHRTCHICSIRMRALYKTKACAHCRTESDHVILSDDAEKKYESFAQTDFYKSDDTLGIHFENEAVFEDTRLLLQYNCPDGECDVACLGWPDLHRHVKTAHSKMMWYVSWAPLVWCSRLTLSLQRPLHTQQKGLHARARALHGGRSAEAPEVWRRQPWRH